MIGPFARIRRSLYRKGVLRPERLGRPVVSVGNLTVGGSGKTPHVRFLADWLSGRGFRVAILSRGYGRRSRGVVWVSDGERVLCSPDAAGDEPYLLAKGLPGTVVVVGESRLEAGRAALERVPVDVFLLDDGFQHLALARDLDLLLVDAGRGFGNGMTLPLGPLREPAGNVAFADALVVTKCVDEAQGERVASAVRFPGEKPRAVTRLVAKGLVDREGRPAPLPPGRNGVAAFSGLARNGQFLETLRAAGYDVPVFRAFQDHHRYSGRELESLAAAFEGRTAVTTEKDLARLPERLPFPVRALRVDVEFLSGWEPLSRLVLSRVGAPEER